MFYYRTTFYQNIGTKFLFDGVILMKCVFVLMKIPAQNCGKAEN